MKLFTSKGAVSPARVQFFLAEKGLAPERVQIDLMSGAHKTPEYRALSPNGRTPALQLDDGTVLCETMAICRYLEELQPEPSLLGRTPLERAQVEMWNRMMELDLLMPMAMAFRHTFPAMKALEDQVPEFGEKQRIVGQKRARRLDQHLAGREYIAADHLTVADITAWCAFRFFRIAGFAIGDDQPHLLAWFQRISSGPRRRRRSPERHHRPARVAGTTAPFAGLLHTLPFIRDPRNALAQGRHRRPSPCRNPLPGLRQRQARRADPWLAAQRPRLGSAGAGADRRRPPRRRL